MANKSKPKPPQPTPESQPKSFWTTVMTQVVASLVVAGILGGLVFFTDIIGLLVDNRIETKLKVAIKESDGKIQSTADKLDTLGQRVAKIEGKLDVLKIQSLATQPQKGGNAKKTSEILNTAKKEGTKLDPELVIDAGKQFISAGVSISNPDVWNAALAFLDYRSFLNAALAPPTDKFAPVNKEHPLWTVQFNHGRPLSPGDGWKAATGREVPAESAAVLEPIGSCIYADKKFGFEFLLVAEASAGITEPVIK